MALDLRLVLLLLTGAGWTWVYISAIRIGLKERTYAIPAFALALNLPWELIYTYLTVVRRAVTPAEQYFSVAWVALDVVVVYTYFRYGRRYWPKQLPAYTFAVWSVLLFAVGVILQLLFLRELGMVRGGLYTSFSQNLVMSLLFIDMFFKRGGPDGQSLHVAVGKWLGTFAPTIYYGGMRGYFVILVIGLLCGVFDLIYIGLLVRAREPGWVARLRMDAPVWALAPAWPGGRADAAPPRGEHVQDSFRA